MKKLLSAALLSAGLFSIGSADTFNLHIGWNLIGSSNSVNVAKDFNKSDVIVVWKWDNGKWKYFSSNDSVKSLFKDKYEIFSNTSPNEGFWVLSASNMTINENVPEENISIGTGEVNESGIAGPSYNLEDYLLNKPIKFELSDISGKSFIDVGMKDVNITFGEDGNGTGIFPNGDKFNLVYKDGVVEGYDDYNNNFVTFKKITSDENGTIVLAKLQKGEFLDAWLVKPTPIDITSLKYPVVFYDENGGKTVIEENGTIVLPDGVSANYSVENGRAVIKNEYNYSDNKGYEEDKYIGIIGEVGNYFVVNKYIFSAYWYIDENNKGKTFNDFIGTDKPINGYILNEDGTITPVNSDAESELTDLNAIYEKLDDTTIKITKCDKNNNCWNDGNLVINSETGQVTKTYHSEIYSIYSTTPIVK